MILIKPYFNILIDFLLIDKERRYGTSFPNMPLLLGPVSTSHFKKGQFLLLTLFVNE